VEGGREGGRKKERKKNIPNKQKLQETSPFLKEINFVYKTSFFFCYELREE
jgi:hypothetical protein